MFLRKTTPAFVHPVMALLLVAVATTGCQHSGSYDLPHGYIPHPAGTAQSVAFNMQASKGEASKYILTSNRFIQNTATLSPKGQAQVEWMVTSLPTNPFPVVIEPCGNPRVDELRRSALVEYFTLQGVADAEQFVIVTAPADTYVPAEQ